MCIRIKSGWRKNEFQYHDFSNALVFLLQTKKEKKSTVALVVEYYIYGITRKISEIRLSQRQNIHTLVIDSG